MGSIRSRPETGKLYFDFQWNGRRCREYTTLRDTAANRRRMQRVLDKIEADITLGTLDYAKYFPNSANARRFAAENVRSGQARESGAPLYQDFVKTWYSELEIGWRASYQEAMRSILRAHLLPEFAEVPVDQITRAQLLDFRARLGRKMVRVGKNSKGHPLNPKTINRIMGVNRQILDEAAARFGFSNPAATIKRLKQRRVEIQPFSMEEVRLILDTVRKDYQPYLTLRFFTGMRSGEAHGLKWRHVDFERREILIRETYTHGRTEYTKTDGSQREIVMTQPVEQALLQTRGADVRESDGYVFHTKNGNPIDNKNFTNRVWYPLLRHLGLDKRRPYQMRHTCATLWLAAGENPEWIARQLGHSTTEMLFRVYSRYVPNLTRRDGTAFDRLVTAAMRGGVAEEAGNQNG